MAIVTFLKALCLTCNILDTLKVLRKPKARSKPRARKPPVCQNGQADMEAGPGASTVGKTEKQPVTRMSTLKREQMRGCLVVWVVWIAWLQLENLADHSIGYILPFYSHIKIIILIYLLASRVTGASILYNYLLLPRVFKPYEGTIDSILTLGFLMLQLIAQIGLLVTVVPVLKAWERAKRIMLGLPEPSAASSDGPSPPGSGGVDGLMRDVVTTRAAGAVSGPRDDHPSGGGGGVQQATAQEPTFSQQITDYALQTPRTLRKTVDVFKPSASRPKARLLKPKAASKKTGLDFVSRSQAHGEEAVTAEKDAKESRYKALAAVRQAAVPIPAPVRFVAQNIYARKTSATRDNIPSANAAPLAPKRTQAARTEVSKGDVRPSGSASTSGPITAQASRPSFQSKTSLYPNPPRSFPAVPTNPFVESPLSNIVFPPVPRHEPTQLITSATVRSAVAIAVPAGDGTANGANRRAARSTKSTIREEPGILLTKRRDTAKSVTSASSSTMNQNMASSIESAAADAGDDGISATTISTKGTKKLVPSSSTVGRVVRPGYSSTTKGHSPLTVLEPSSSVGHASTQAAAAASTSDARIPDKMPKPSPRKRKRVLADDAYTSASSTSTSIVPPKPTKAKVVGDEARMSKESATAAPSKAIKKVVPTRPSATRNRKIALGSVDDKAKATTKAKTKLINDIGKTDENHNTDGGKDEDEDLDVRGSAAIPATPRRSKRLKAS